MGVLSTIYREILAKEQLVVNYKLKDLEKVNLILEIKINRNLSFRDIILLQKDYYEYILWYFRINNYFLISTLFLVSIILLANYWIKNN